MQLSQNKKKVTLLVFSPYSSFIISLGNYTGEEQLSENIYNLL